jgi:hypothetical protein
LPTDTCSTADKRQGAVSLLLEDGDPSLDAEFVGIQTVAVA